MLSLTPTRTSQLANWFREETRLKCAEVSLEKTCHCVLKNIFLTEALTFPEGTHYHLEKGSCLFKNRKQTTWRVRQGVRRLETRLHKKDSKTGVSDAR